MNDFSFAENGIDRIVGSRFDDQRESLLRRWTSIHNVDFSEVDCESVIFSESSNFERWPDSQRYVIIKDCGFDGCSLRNARFDGALLTWTEKPPRSHFTSSGPDDDEGSQWSWGPFNGADLAGASFRGCKFVNADFRDARNVRDADFFRATGLESTYFDEHYEWAAVWENANRAE